MRPAPARALGRGAGSGETPAGAMEVLLQACASEGERRDLEDLADRLFAELAKDVPDDADAFELLAMPEPRKYPGAPQPLPTIAESMPVAPLPPLPPPRRRRTDWTEDDDEHLLRLFDLYGSKWREIARASGSPRSDDAIRNRIQRLNERANTPPAAKPRAPAAASAGEAPRRPWSEGEDKRLRELVETTRSWRSIACEFTGRTPHACRNRVFRLLDAVR